MNKISPLKAIRANCLDCNGSASEVKMCPCVDCPLYPFRFGKNPYSKRVLTEEQKVALVGRLTKGRSAAKTPQTMDDI